MKIRLALVLTALLPLMVACKPQDGSADATAPATPAATTAPEAAPATTDTAAAPATEQAAASATDKVPVPAQARLVGPEPVARG